MSDAGSGDSQYTHLKDRYDRILDVSRQLNSTLDLPSLLHLILRASSDLVNSETASIMLIDQETRELRFEASLDLENGGEAEHFVVPMEGSIAGWVATHGQHQVIDNVRSDDRYFSKVDDEVGTQARGMLAVPLKTQETVIGVVEAINKRADAAWTDDDVEVLSTFADHAAIAIQTARFFESEVARERMERELSIARTIQRSLLPGALPALPGWEVAAYYEAARQVGGDLYDFFPLTDPGGKTPSHLGMVIADVADKGVPAALMMAVSRTLIRATAATTSSPAAVMTRVNRLIYDDSSASNLFVTVFYAALDTITGTLTYANGGHNPPLIWRSETQTFEELTGHGLAVGIMENVNFPEGQTTIHPGDVLICYTDGVNEAMNASRMQFEEEGMKRAAQSRSAESAQDVLDAVVEAVRNFVGTTPQSDDFTLFVIKRTA